MPSVLQDWVMELPLREQGTLLTGVRGCDVAPKVPLPADEFYTADNGRAISPERQLVAFLRYCFMVPADEREVDIAGSFFQSKPPEYWKPSMFGHYPQHWYAHVMHSFEVVAYRCPYPQIRAYAEEIYLAMVHNLHLNPEPQRYMIKRLSEDRIAKGNVVS